MKQKTRLLLIALAAILLTVLTQPTLAFYTHIGKATNVVTSGSLEMRIYEKTAGDDDFPEEGVYIIPGDIVSKRVSIQNVCGAPFYLRVKLIHGTTKEELDPEEALKLDINTTDWVLVDGYYYFNHILQPGEVTPPLFTQVEIVGDKVDQHDVGTMLSITVSAQAVQSEHNPVDYPWEAQGWPAD